MKATFKGYREMSRHFSQISQQLRGEHPIAMWLFCSYGNNGYEYVKISAAKGLAHFPEGKNRQGFLYSIVRICCIVGKCRNLVLH